MSGINDRSVAYIVHDPENGDYLSWSSEADMGHGHTALFTADRIEAMERMLREARETRGVDYIQVDYPDWANRVDAALKQD